MDIFKYGKHYWINFIIGRSNDQLDKVVIEPISGSKSLGYYSQALNITSLISGTFLSIFSSISNSIFGKYKNNEDNLYQYFYLLFGLFLRSGIVVTIIIYLFSEDIIVLIYTEKWILSAPILTVIAWFGLAFSLQNFLKNYFNHIGKPAEIFVSQLVLLISVVVLMLPLTLTFGIIGTAYSMVISYLFSFAILFKKIGSALNFNPARLILSPLFVLFSVLIIFEQLEYFFSEEVSWPMFFFKAASIALLYLFMTIIFDIRFLKILTKYLKNYEK